MAVILNERAFEHAKRLIREDRLVWDERDQWVDHQPSAAGESAYMGSHGWREYALWYLGIDESHPEDTKAHYRFPYGDFRDVHRCGVLAVESRAAQYKHHEVETAAAHLHGMIDAHSARIDASQKGP